MIAINSLHQLSCGTILLSAMTPQQNLTPIRAVVIGQLVVNVPVLTIIILGFVIGRIWLSPAAAILFFPVGIALAWLWWSATVPRWREWARIQGADVQETQRIAQMTGLVWPKGSVFEKTEFRVRRRP